MSKASKLGKEKWDKVRHWCGHLNTSRRGTKCWYKVKPALGFPGGAVVKNPPANEGDTGLSPGPGRSHMPQSN